MMKEQEPEDRGQKQGQDKIFPDRPKVAVIILPVQAVLMCRCGRPYTDWAVRNILINMN